MGRVPTGRKPGRPAKPANAKLGNVGHRAKKVVALHAVDGAVVVEVPEPRRPLNADGLAMWNRMWRAGAGWLHPEIDIEICLLVCEQVDERALLRAATDWRSRSARRQLGAQIVANLASCGFTPSDRGRLGVAARTTPDPLDVLRHARSERLKPLDR